MELTDEDFLETIDLELNEDIVKKFVPEHDSLTSPCVEGMIKVYAPRVFRALQRSDGGMANITESFSLTDNLNSITQIFGGPDGGKSGEFFYFSKNKKLMIKTMGNSEVDSMLRNLKKYVQHFVLNEDSMIVKIYGVYTFTINKQVNSLLIMRNITQCPGEFIERTFDLKGSTYDREVRKEKKNKGKHLSEMTLKDIDF